MRTQLILLSSLALLAFPACTGGSGDGSGGGGGNGGGGGGGTGGGSGVPGAKLLNDMTPSEVMDFCSWSIAEQGGENQDTDCGDGTTISTGTVAECTGSFSDLGTCDVTVGQAEDCVDAMAADPCTALGNAACQALFSCAAN